jgi:hypothetical protein
MRDCLSSRRDRRNAAVRGFTQARHLLLQVAGETAQFVGEHAKAERRLPGPLGEENGVHGHEVDLEGRGYDDS